MIKSERGLPLATAKVYGHKVEASDAVAALLSATCAGDHAVLEDPTVWVSDLYGAIRNGSSNVFCIILISRMAGVR